MAILVFEVHKCSNCIIPAPDPAAPIGRPADANDRRAIGLVLPHGNLEAMNLHLQEISRRVTQGAFAVLTLDGAGWHQKGDRLVMPDNIGLLHLPPYSPELNPAENIWEFLRQNDLSNRVYATYEALVDARCNAWNKLMAAPERIRSIATREYAKTVGS